MGFDITFKKSVQKDLSKIPKAVAVRILDKIDKELPGGAGSFPALEGEFAGLRKFRVGDYRVIDTLRGNDVLILHIAHRNAAILRGGQTQGQQCLEERIDGYVLLRFLESRDVGLTRLEFRNAVSFELS